LAKQRPTGAGNATRRRVGTIKQGDVLRSGEFKTVPRTGWMLRKIVGNRFATKIKTTLTVHVRPFRSQ
jgi:hypothetical protein